MEKIFVAVRFRPTAPASSNDSSTSGGDREWRIDDTRISLLHRAAPIPSASFGFDHVFDETATNTRIYGVLDVLEVLYVNVKKVALITLPPPREVARPEMPRDLVPATGPVDEEEWVTVFGFLPGDTNLVLREFEKCGIVLRHVPGPRDANWMHILYQHA